MKRLMINRYITAAAESDILKYLAEWKTGRYGKKLTWAILSKAFGYSRQALSGNAAVRAEYDEVKKTLKDAISEVDALTDIAKENKRLIKDLAKAKELIHHYEQKYMRWQINAQEKGISIEVLNRPIPPSMKEELRKRSQDN